MRIMLCGYLWDPKTQEIEEMMHRVVWDREGMTEEELWQEVWIEILHFVTKADSSVEVTVVREGFYDLKLTVTDKNMFDFTVRAPQMQPKPAADVLADEFETWSISGA